VQLVQTCIESFINLLQRSIDTSGYHPLKVLIRKAWNKSPSFAINNLCLQNAQKTNTSQQHPLVEWKAKATNRHKIKNPPCSILFVFLDILRLTSDCKRLRNTNPSHNHKFRENPQPNPHPQGPGLRNHNSAEKGEKKAATPKEAFASGRGKKLNDDDDEDNSKERGAKARECWIPVRNCPVVFAAVCLGRGVTRHSKRFVSAEFWSVIVLLVYAGE
jgi:hypothetical protein